jgi:beta-mannosidase
MPLAAGQWTLTISTRDLAQWVAVDIEGFAPSVSWFHLAPGTSREVTLSPTRDDMLPHGHVRAVNSAVAAQVVTS